MKHYSEHILDLFVRNSNLISDSSAEIESHLSVCVGCRTVAENLREFYLLAEEDKKLLASGDETDDALIVQPGYIRTRPLVRITEKNALPVRLWQYARHRPFATTMSMFALTAILLFTLRQFGAINDTNPVEFNYSTGEKKIMVYNKNGIQLWSVSVKDLGPAEDFNVLHRRAKFDLLLDIDHDGKNEFLTTRFLVAQPTDGVRKLNIVNSDGSYRRSIVLSLDTIHFRSLQYSRPFEPTFLLFDSTTQSLFIAASNLRSPWVLQRYDRSLSLLSEYWHFGGIQFGQVDINNDGRQEIALYGKNDVDDVTMNDFPFLTILDPSKITDVKEDAATQGFGLTASDAAIMSIRFPSPDISLALKRNPAAVHILNENNEGFDVFVAVEYKPGEPLTGLEYHYSKSLARITGARWNTGFEAFHQKLKQEGRISSAFGEQYLEELATKVAYWNGKNWILKTNALNN